MDAGVVHLLVIVNNAAVNVGVHIAIGIPAFNSFGINSEVECLGHPVIPGLTF